MAVKIPAASAIAPVPPIARPTAARSKPPATTIAVSERPDQPPLARVPGQSSHQNAIIATSGRANVTTGPSSAAECAGPPAPAASNPATGSTNSSPASPRFG